VLFVSGAAGAPLRYRVLHQAEQLALQRVACAFYGDQDARLWRQVRACDLLYLYRAQDTPVVRRAIVAARARGIPLIYDTDDLIWDQRLVEYCNIEQHYSPAEVAGFRAHFRATEALMRQADRFITSTAYLAEALAAHFGKPAYVNANALSQQAVALSAPHYRRRLARPAGLPVTLGYFSGWPKAHEEDFAVALPAVLALLDACPQARLRIVGHFDTARLPAALQSQVDLAPFVPWERLPEQIAQVDINLAPVVDNPHRRGKSAVKFLEAALVGVPTVASDLEPYQAIVHGHSGFLAGTTGAWRHALLELVSDHARRAAVGAAAREQVLANDTTAARAPHFAALLHKLSNKVEI
jgi:glycosyltransferase involved in cell wall biosynthesis